MAEILGMDFPQNYQPQLVQDFSQQQEISQLTKAAFKQVIAKSFSTSHHQWGR